MTAKTCETVSKTPIKPELPNSPVGTKIWCIGKADGWRNHADGLEVCRDTQCAGTDVKMAENVNRKVKMGQRSKRQNSPYRVEIKTAKHPRQCKHISNKENNGYAPQITLIESLDM